MGIYVQYGCGLSCPAGWLNFDASPRLRIERLPLLGSILRSRGKTLFPENVLFGDIVAGLPVEDASVSAIYSSHVLEHLDRGSIDLALRNTFRLLEPGGVFRLIVPDLIWRARNLLAESEAGQMDAADRFMRSCYLGEESRPRGLVSLLRAALGNSAHRWMYDFGLLSSLLADAGFGDIRRCNFGDANNPKFKEVEEQDRFFEQGHEELALECRRLA